MGHTYSNILVHVIFSTKGRTGALYPAVREELLAYMHGVANNIGAAILMAGGVDDHVHVLIKIKPSHSTSEVVGKLKANSSRGIHETHPNMKNFAWQSGFSAFSVSESSVKNVKTYIQKQAEHHRRLSFAEELRRFLEKNGIAYDPEHYLD